MALSYERSQASISLAIENYEEILRQGHHARDREGTGPLLAWPVACRSSPGPTRRSSVTGGAAKSYPELRDETRAEPRRPGVGGRPEADGRPAGTRRGRPGRTHVDALLEGRYAMPAILAIGYMTESLAAVPAAADSQADRARRGQIKAQIDGLHEMNDAVGSLAAQTDTTHARLEQRGKRIVFMQPLPGRQPPCWVLAGFAEKWLCQRWLGQVCARAWRHPKAAWSPYAMRTASSCWARPWRQSRALSTQLSLSRWGLPWTFEVGFSHLASLQAQSRQRHLLLTGFIVFLVLLIALGSGLGLHLVRREMELSKLKSDFVDNVSHELRTPVTSIKMFSEMLQSGQTTDPVRQQEYFRLLASESGRLTRMIDNILNFSRIMAGRIQLRRQRVDIAQFMEEQRQQLELQARTTGHRVHLHMGSDLPACLIDPDAISRVLANLVSNATKYSPKEQPIVLTVQRRDGMISLIVSDRGLGIPEAGPSARI